MKVIKSLLLSSMLAIPVTLTAGPLDEYEVELSQDEFNQLIDELIGAIENGSVGVGGGQGGGEGDQGGNDNQGDQGGSDQGGDDDIVGW